MGLNEMQFSFALERSSTNTFPMKAIPGKSKLLYFGFAEQEKVFGKVHHSLI